MWGHVFCNKGTMNQTWIVAYLYEINLYSYFQIGIICINMRKGISNKSQTTFVRLHLDEFQRETNREREKRKVKEAPTAQRDPWHPEFRWSMMMGITAPWDTPLGSTVTTSSLTLSSHVPTPGRCSKGVCEPAWEECTECEDSRA